MKNIPRFGLSHLMGDDIHIKCGDSFSEIELHWHDYYELIFYFDADVSCKINGEDIELGDNSLYLLTPFDFHKTKNNKADNKISFLNISFTKEALDSETVSKLSRALYIKGIKVSDPEYSLLEFLKTNALFLKNRKSVKRYVLNALLDIITEKGDRINSGEYGTKTEMLRRVSEYVCKNYSQPITLSDIANEMHLAPAYFSSLFSKTAGCTFVHYLNAFRLNYSRQLLITTDKSITQICFECGFSSLSHFLREFKTHYRVTPTEYKRNALR